MLLCELFIMINFLATHSNLYVRTMFYSHELWVPKNCAPCKIVAQYRQNQYTHSWWAWRCSRSLVAVVCSESRGAAARLRAALQHAAGRRRPPTHQRECTHTLTSHTGDGTRPNLQVTPGSACVDVSLKFVNIGLVPIVSQRIFRNNFLESFADLFSLWQ